VESSCPWFYKDFYRRCVMPRHLLGFQGFWSWLIMDACNSKVIDIWVSRTEGKKAQTSKGDDGCCFQCLSMRSQSFKALI